MFLHSVSYELGFLLLKIINSLIIQARYNTFT